MKNLKLSPSFKLALVLLLFVVTFLMAQIPTYAVCGLGTACCPGCGGTSQVNYFTDAARTQYCGTCTFDCDGITTCSGQTSPYYRIVFARCCEC